MGRDKVWIYTEWQDTREYVEGRVVVPDFSFLGIYWSLNFTNSLKLKFWNLKSTKSLIFKSNKTVKFKFCKTNEIQILQNR